MPCPTLHGQLIMGYSYKMFEPNMDNYPDDEMDKLKHAFEQSITLMTSLMVHVYIHLQPSYPLLMTWPSLYLHFDRSCSMGYKLRCHIQFVLSAFRMSLSLVGIIMRSQNSHALVIHPAIYSPLEESTVKPGSGGRGHLGSQGGNLPNLQIPWVG